MNEGSIELLEEIGRQLNRNIFPTVKNSGIVSPSDSSVFPNPLGKETHHARQRQARSTTEPWQGHIGGQGASGRTREFAGPRAAGQTAPLFDPVVSAVYPDPLALVVSAYPAAQVWMQEGGFWMYTESALLPELGRTVSFLSGVSTEKHFVKSWAFYSSAVGVSWIGPRHTNFPDGSICAFEPRDGTWRFGDSLVELLDLYTVWGVRHLHLEVFGSWPGPQAVAQPYERMLELADDEHCGCGVSDKRYVDCCKDADLRRNRIFEAIKFGNFSHWAIRQPPEEVLQFMLYRNQLPAISGLI